MSFTLLLFSMLVLALLALAYWISDLLLFARRQPVTHTPNVYGLEYEDVVFQSSDGLALHGWWIPANSEPDWKNPSPVVVLLHPMFANRQGFYAQLQGWPALFQTDFDLLKTASIFHQAGYTVLTFDFRSHGESQRGICAGGLNEDQDVTGAVEYVFRRIEAHAPAEAVQVGLVGFGLGASAALAAVGRVKGHAKTIRVFSSDNEGATGWTDFPPANVKRLSFLVAIQPASLQVALRGYIRHLAPILDLIIVPLVNQLCQSRGAYPLDAALLLKFLPEINVPVLYIQPRQDPWGAWREVQCFYDSTSNPKEICWIEQPLRRLEAYIYVCTHLESVLAFINHQAGRQVMVRSGTSSYSLSS